MRSVNATVVTLLALALANPAVALPATDFGRLREAAAVRAAARAAGLAAGPIRRMARDHYRFAAGPCTVDAFLRTRSYLKERPTSGPRRFDVLIGTPKC